jgi:carboxylesterase
LSATAKSLPERPCLVIHGLGGGPYELEPLIAGLKREGWNVMAPVLPGHGEPGERMPDSCWPDWIEAVERAHGQLITASGGQGSRLLVVGFSTGGTLALELALRRPVGRLVLLAPFLEIKYMGLLPVRPEATLAALARVLPDLPRRPPAVRDPAMRAWAQARERYKTFSLNATLSALELIEQLRPRIAAIQVPALIQQGRLDQVVEPQGAQWLHDRIGSAWKKLSWYEKSDHLLALDREREAVVTEALAFAQAPLACENP